MLYGELKRAYATYNRLDPEMKKAASEIAAKYPYCTEHVAKVIVANGFDKEKAEEQIKRELVLGKAGF
jgi:putative cell wall-binding protein